MSTNTNTLRILLRCDFPFKEQVIQIEGSKTFAQLRAEAATTIGISLQRIEKYAFFSVIYGEDVNELGKKGDSQTLSESGVVDVSTIFVRAPSEIKPPRRRPKKGKKGEEKEEKGGGEKDRYKGLSVKNIFSKLNEVKEPKKRKVVLEYIDIYAGEIVKKPQFSKLPKETVIEIVKSDRLNIKEVDLFDAVLAWGHNELKSSDKSVSDDKDALKKVLADILPHIRFPVMTTQDVATKVTQSNLLDADQVLDLFTYLGTKGNKNAKPGKSLSKFNAKERKPRRPPSWFKWDVNKKHAQLVLSPDGLVAQSLTTSYYQPVFGDIELTEGVHEWEIVLTQFYVNSYSVNVGVVPTSFTNYQTSQMLGYSGHIPAWCFACGQGQKYHNGSQISYGRTCAQGDVIRVRLDLDKKTIEFFVNDTSQGVAYTNVTGPVRPALSLYGSNTTTLRFPK